MFLLDTNILSELRPGKPLPSRNIQLWAESLPVEQLYLSAISILELELGVLLMERKDPRQGRHLRAWLQSVQAQFSLRVLPFTAKTAILCAAMHVPNRRPDRDTMIAATAKEHGFTVVTRNTTDFTGCAVNLLNPWLAPGEPAR